jgi:hypothetical protein
MNPTNTKLLLASLALATIIIGVIAQSVIRQYQQNQLRREITRALGTSRSNPQRMQAVLKAYQPQLVQISKHPPLCQIGYPQAAANDEIGDFRRQECALMECIAIGPCGNVNLEWPLSRG